MLDDKDIEKLIEAQKLVFATKENLQDARDDVTKFKDEILTGQDEILKELRVLTEEKPIKDDQDKREKKVLEIHNTALVKNKILSEEEAKEVNNLRVF